MPNIASLLKHEIQRVARKEIRQEVSKLRVQNTVLRKRLADMNQRLEALERGCKQSARGAAAAGAGKRIEEIDSGVIERSRITSSMIRSLRERLGLTQAQLAKLLGVSAQSVYQWEAREGSLQLRRRTKAAILDIRGLGKREVHRRIEAPATKASGAGRRRGRPAKSKG